MNHLEKRVNNRMDKYCVFILTHGRADNVITLKTLKKCGFDGEWYCVVDDEDEQLDKYIENFGEDRVKIFSKDEIQKTFDVMDLSNDRRTIVYARNACFQIANKMGYRKFLELDDDYTSFMFRYIEDGKLKGKNIENISSFFEKMFEFLDNSKAISVAIAQGGDFIGGKDNGFFYKGLSRKCMNTFFCRTDRPFKFIGRVNEDVNTYTLYGQQGKLLFTFTKAQIIQKNTQTNKGGMTEMYLDSGTYVKSFYSVMCSPSCVKIGLMGNSNKRIHHRVDWERCTPKILNQKYRKC